jgi:hypothetical protein
VQGGSSVLRIKFSANKPRIAPKKTLAAIVRDWGVLKKLNISSDNEVIDCVIIYPNNNSIDNFTDRELKETSINQFKKFYKCGIKLPIKN